MWYKIFVPFLLLIGMIHKISGFERCYKMNEIWDSSENRCESNCGYKGFQNFKNQNTSCVCKEGFARNQVGDCISSIDCALECCVNEYLDINSINNKEKCIYACICKPGHFRKNEVCVPCQYPKQYKDRCEVFSILSCKCTKCKPNFRLCQGNCRENHINCNNYDFNKCECTQCNKGYKYCNGKCVKECKYNEIFDKDSCSCIKCLQNQVVCKGSCITVPAHCVNYDGTHCRCNKCEKNYVLCKDKCILKPNHCSNISLQSCTCSKCENNYFLCNNQCHPVIQNCNCYDENCQCLHCNNNYTYCNGNCYLNEPNCNNFDIETCKCLYCIQGYKFCGGKCIFEDPNCIAFDWNTCKCKSCKENYKICQGICKEQIFACSTYDDKNCVCKTCQKDYKLCQGNCFPDDKNCLAVNNNTCSCDECKEKHFICNQRCYAEISNCVHYSILTCQCEQCRNGFNLCSNHGTNQCISECTGNQILDAKICQCKCPPGSKVCSGQCTNMLCERNELFSEEQCRCICKNDYYRNKFGVCCPSKNFFPLEFLTEYYCPKNEIYIPNYNVAMESTCQGAKRIQPETKCFCRNGFFRDIKTKFCVKNCPHRGCIRETHEIFQYGSERYCPSKSENSTITIQKAHGYYCLEGYGRNGKNCVKCT